MVISSSRSPVSASACTSSASASISAVSSSAISSASASASASASISAVSSSAISSASASASACASSASASISAVSSSAISSVSIAESSMLSDDVSIDSGDSLKSSLYSSDIYHDIRGYSFTKDFFIVPSLMLIFVSYLTFLHKCTLTHESNFLSNFSSFNSAKTRV